MKKFLAANSFVFSIAVVVLAAAIFPELGSSQSILPVRTLKGLGVFLIFFNQGVLLPGEEVRQGFLEGKLHALVQITTYLFFPVLVFMVLWGASGFFTQPDLRMGFLYLAFLPTTVSSAVALTSIADGNVSGALFNCALSSIIGVFLVPLLCIVFLNQGGAESQMEILSILRTVSLMLLLPLAVGQAARPVLKKSFSTHKKGIKGFNNGVILFIIWAAFCQSFLRNVWNQVSAWDLGVSVALAAFVLLMASAFVWGMSAKLRLPPPSRITALFCGSQKSIAMGLPLSAMIFSGHTGSRVELSLLVLPLMIYHPMQLIFAGWILPRLQRYAVQKR